MPRQMPGLVLVRGILSYPGLEGENAHLYFLVDAEAVPRVHAAEDVNLKAIGAGY